jgi:hypothetical protein
MKFDNGAVVVSVTSGTPPASVGDPATDLLTVTTITSGPGGAMPAGYSTDAAATAWPSAILVMMP